MKKLILSFMVSMLFISFNSFAVGPTIPTHAKYSPCSVTGIVLTNYDQENNSASCPIGYSEKTTKIFINQASGTVPVVFQDSQTQPPALTCVFVTGVMLSPCYGSGQPICIVTAMSEDFSCDPEEE